MFTFSLQVVLYSIYQINNTRAHAQSYPGKQGKPSYSFSYPRFPPSKGSSLVGGKSEGSSTLGKNIEVRERKGHGPEPTAEASSARTSRVLDYSTDESGAEDEHIVRIDSPSTLSFRQTS